MRADQFSEHATSLDEADENYDDGDHEQSVYEAAHGGTGHQSENPQYDEDDSDGH
jgi:hypothetical protein